MRLSDKPAYAKIYFFAGLLIGAALMVFYAVNSNLRTIPFRLQLVLLSVTLMSLNAAFEAKGRLYAMLTILMVVLCNVLVEFHYFRELPKMRYQLELVQKFVIFLTPLVFVYGVRLLPVANIVRKTFYAAFANMLCFLIVLPLRDNMLSMAVAGGMSVVLFTLVLSKEKPKQHLKAALLFVASSLALYLMFFPLRKFAMTYSVIMLSWLLQIAAVFMVFAFKNINRMPNE